MLPRGFVLLLLTFLLSVAQAERPILAAVPAGLPPPLLNEETPELTGIVPEYTMALIEILGREGSMALLPRNRLTNYLTKGVVDFLCYTNKEWAGDASQFLWTDNLFEKREVILGPKDMPKKIKDFNGQVIGTMLGYAYPKLEPLFQENKILREDGPDEQANLNKLLNQHIYYVVTDEIFLDHYEKTHHNVELNRKRLFEQQYPITCSVSKNGTVSVKELNAAIVKLKSSKKLEGIFKKHGCTLYL